VPIFNIQIIKIGAHLHFAIGVISHRHATGQNNSSGEKTEQQRIKGVLTGLQLGAPTIHGAPDF